MQTMQRNREEFDKHPKRNCDKSERQKKKKIIREEEKIKINIGESQRVYKRKRDEGSGAAPTGVM